jgi:methyl-accepting chemotaxis protein
VEIYRSSGGGRDGELLELEMHGPYEQLEPGQAILVSTDGRTLADWPPALASARVVLHPDQSLEVDSRTAAGENRRMLLRGAPGVGLPGATLYILPAEPVAEASRRQIRNSVNQSLLLALLFAFAFTLVAALALSRYIFRPMRALAAVAGRIAEGRFDERVSLHGCDEIGSLAATFNTMADHLAHTEQLRRRHGRRISARTPYPAHSHAVPDRSHAGRPAPATRKRSATFTNRSAS